MTRFNPDQPPNVPPLVNVTAAAELLGVAKANIERLRQQGRMPEAIEVEGGKRPTPVYVKSEVVELAGELKAERRERSA